MRLFRATALLALSCLVSSASTPAQAQGVGSLVVTITSPRSGSSVSGSVNVNASVTIIGSLTVRSVQFKLDGANLGGEDTSAPYEVSWNTITTSNGSHTLTAVARDLLSLPWTSDPVTVTVSNPPTITSFTPAGGPVGTSVIISGTNFTGATAVRFNGVTASFAVNSATLIQATVPAGATTGPISVTTPNGTGTSVSAFFVTPTLTSFTPASGPVGTSVTISGTSFTGATAVRFNGVTASFTVNSATSIQATVPAGATTGPISVTTPGGTATSTSAFTVTTGAPTITSFTPASGPAGTTVTISGTNFTGATAVTFNGTSANFTVNSATSIQTTVPSGATTGPIRVTTPGGTATSTSAFTVTASAPTITSFTPASGPVGTSVTISGTNFTGTTTVAFNGTSATFTVNSATSIQATVSAGATTGPISVTTPGGTATSTSAFTVTTTGPTITSFTPASGAVGTSVTISGTNFTGATAVAFNGTSATFTVNSATSIQATVPAGATTGPISVTTPGGTATSTSAFTVTTTGAPTITSFTPTSGPVGTTVTISGTNFTGATVVAFNGTSATFTVNSATSIQATVPAGATTGPISVTTPGGTATSAGAFTVTASSAPTITSFTPTSGPVGTTVTISGTNFTGATAVSFNGTSATFTVIAATSIQAAVPAGATTGPISVTTPGGSATSASAFTVTASAPTCATPLDTFAGSTTFNNTARSQMWITDNTWWGAFSDASTGIYFYKLQGSTFVKGDFINANFGAGKPDAFWNGTELFILIQESGSLARLYKYSYLSASGAFALMAGFPVDLPLAGLATVVSLDQDSTGKLWATYPSGSNVYILWSTSVDHRTWDTTGFVLAPDISTTTTEASAITHFGGNKIGVAWGNQSLAEYAFRFHNDGDAETVWSPKEVVDCCGSAGSVADDHLNLRAAPDGRLFLVAKDSIGNGNLHLYVRGVNGPWGQKTAVDTDSLAQPTRPKLQLDVDANLAFVLYHNSTDKTVYVTRSGMSSLGFAPRCVFLAQGNNVTSTKQNVNATTGLIAADSTNTGTIFPARFDLSSVATSMTSGPGSEGTAASGTGPVMAATTTGASPLNGSPVDTFGPIWPGRLSISETPADHSQWWWLRGQGANTIVNLDAEMYDFAQYAFESFLWMPLGAGEAPTEESATSFLKFIRSCDNQPAHIVGGARDGRAALVALLRYALDGWTIEDALGEGQRLNGDAPLSPAQVTWLQGWAASHRSGSEQLGSCSTQ
jgi:hypothetical protein